MESFFPLFGVGARKAKHTTPCKPALDVTVQAWKSRVRKLGVDRGGGGGASGEAFW